jgi:hypothetical protein
MILFDFIAVKDKLFYIYKALLFTRKELSFGEAGNAPLGIKRALFLSSSSFWKIVDDIQVCVLHLCLCLCLCLCSHNYNHHIFTGSGDYSEQVQHQSSIHSWISYCSGTIQGQHYSELGGYDKPVQGCSAALYCRVPFY